MSGVKAYVDIYEKTGQYPILVEANDRLGGRMRTERLKLNAGRTVPVDLGGQYIVGKSNGTHVNPSY